MTGRHVDFGCFQSRTRRRAVAADPESGKRKKGDLSALHVYQFRALGQLYLLGYRVDEGVRLIYLEAVGPHENVYRDLKR
ncbi:MAG: hypothetical protein C1943_08240 [Halochromatium sp.]|nr:hypothetical protein [Halochromatium sp.]